MRGGAVAGGRRRRSFVEMCIVSCLSASPACVCGQGAAPWDCPRRCLPCSRDSHAPLDRTNSGWLSFGWLQCSQLTDSMQSRCGGGVAARLRLTGARSGLPCPVPACCCRGRLAGAGSGSHSGVEVWWSRTRKGSSGGRKEGAV